MIKFRAYSYVEHGTIYLKADTIVHAGMGNETVECPLDKYYYNSYSMVKRR